MRKILILVVCLLPLSLIYGQYDNPKFTAINVGFAMGGGSLLGVDFEVVPIDNRVGFQIGAGISSVGGGINYHLRKGANSPFISLQYMHQGFGNNHYASWLGPMFIYRTKKVLQVGIGFARMIDYGPQMPEKYVDQDFSLNFQLGMFF